MKFLADECCDAPLIEKLRALGYDVLYVVEEMRAEPDTEVLAKAFAENRILITEDKDFGELVYRLKKEAAGIILLRFAPSQAELKWSRLRELIQRNDVILMNHFIVVDAEKFRIRPL